MTGKPSSLQEHPHSRLLGGWEQTSSEGTCASSAPLLVETAPPSSCMVSPSFCFPAPAHMLCATTSLAAKLDLTRALNNAAIAVSGLGMGSTFRNRVHSLIFKGRKRLTMATVG